MVFAVCTRTEELHLFTNDHRAYAASNSVVIVVVEVRTHQVIVLILQRRGVDGHFSGEFRSSAAVSDHRMVMFGSWRRTHGVQGVQETEAVLITVVRPSRPIPPIDRLPESGRQRTAFIVFRSTQEANHTQFYDRGQPFPALLVR